MDMDNLDFDLERELLDSPFSPDFQAHCKFENTAASTNSGEADAIFAPNEVDSLIRDLTEVCAAPSRFIGSTYSGVQCRDGSPKSSESGDSAIADDHYALSAASSDLTGYSLESAFECSSGSNNIGLYHSGLSHNVNGQYGGTESYCSTVLSDYETQCKLEPDYDALTGIDDLKPGIAQDAMLVSSACPSTIRVRLADGQIAQLVVAAQSQGEAIAAQSRGLKIPISRCLAAKPKSIQPKSATSSMVSEVSRASAVIVAAQNTSKTCVLVPQSKPTGSLASPPATASAPSILARSSNVKIVVPTNISTVGTPVTFNPTVKATGSTTGSTYGGALNHKVERMIRNREAAALSRKRKKEYTEQLESQLRTFSADNERLVRENERLKAHVRQLETEKSALTADVDAGLAEVGGGLPSLAKIPRIRGVQKVALLGVLLLAFNIFTLFGVASPISRAGTQSPVLGGRTLLELQNVRGQEAHAHFQSFLKSRDHVDSDQGFNSNANTSRLLEQCAAYFLMNSTDAERVTNDLNDFVAMYHASSASSSPNPLPKSRSRRRTARRRADVAVNAAMAYVDAAERALPDSSGAVQVYNNAQWRTRAFDAFLKSLQRRNDTFYFVALHDDHILVPPTEETPTQTNSSNVKRPRMSLLMPSSNLSSKRTAGLNGFEEFKMMQIDCEVFDTKFITLNSPAWTDFSNAARSQVNAKASFGSTSQPGKKVELSRNLARLRRDFVNVEIEV